MSDKVRTEAANAVAMIEEVARANGHVQLRALSTGHKEIVADVASALREKAISVDQIYVERGRLDDVFREITTHDHHRSTGRAAVPAGPSAPSTRACYPTR